MERALDPTLLRGALGDIGNLPTPDQLREMLANAEVSAFFVQDHELPPSLLDTAWVLHQVGTVRPVLQVYDAIHQVQANAVAAHIFDLALARGLAPGEELATTFAAQVSSIRGDRTPNATALAARLPEPQASIVRSPGRASLEAGCSLLSLVRPQTTALLRRLEGELVAANGGDHSTLEGSPIAAAAAVVRGSRLLLRYLASGGEGDLAGARDEFERATNDVGAHRDLDSRWVAAHLLDLTDDLGGSSVWAVLPPTTPPVVGRAMTLGEPPVMALWPPQIALLQDDEHSPLRPEVRRSVMTFPTSAGKTLLTQLIIANHLATSNTAVCVVAPSHSLCREIRQGLDRRLWVLRKTVIDGGPLGDPDTPSAPVVVMTPERLAGRLRTNATDLLAGFGLFILDEAHLVGDETRGWTFETTISRLHELTLATDHRMIVVSAALGGTATVRTWLDVGATPTTTAARWRGPRRMHATFHTEERGAVRVVPAAPPQRLDRQVREMWGIVSLYIDGGSATAVRGAPVGEVIKAGTSTTKPTRAKQLSLVVNHAAQTGSVLTVHATKIGAERLAKALAEDREDRPPSPLVRLAEQRLGASHPLVAVLRKGVAYHHAALPLDVQIEIESGVRAREIDIVCATTTLTEGVNLPVRTVVIAERGYYDGTERNFISLIDQAALLNAAGRAGRAGRETEGWVIIAREPFAPSERVALASLDRDEEVRSRLSSSAALHALDAYEVLVAATAGVVLDEVPDAVDGFLGYCWYLAEAATALSPASRADTVVAGLRRALAWQQLSPELTSRWEVLAVKLTRTFEATDPLRRRRWAQTGTGLSANLVLEQVAGTARPGAIALRWDDTLAPLKVLEVLLDGEGMSLLLSLLPERDRRFKRRRFGAIDLIDVEMRSLVLDWVAGVDLAELADRHLGAVEGDDADAYRFEQLSSFLTKVCEHHLPWTTAIVLDWIRQDTGRELCPNLPSHLHYGAATTAAVSLMTGGVRSRRLSVSIGTKAAETNVPDDNLRGWLTDLGLSRWRSEFEAAPAELSDLLQFVRDPAANIGQPLLDGLTVEVPCTVDSTVAVGDGGSIVHDYGEERPSPLVIRDVSGVEIGQLEPSVYHEVSMLLDAGFQVFGTVARVEGSPSVELRIEVE
jgi:hypothetical protein